MKQLTSTRRVILENIKAGKDPYEGFKDSQLGGAIRSIQLMRGVYGLIWIDKTIPRLTEAGLKALETGEYHERPLPRNR
jgi:hypothetical protein